MTWGTCCKDTILKQSLKRHLFCLFVFIFIFHIKETVSVAAVVRIEMLSNQLRDVSLCFLGQAGH